MYAGWYGLTYLALLNGLDELSMLGEQRSHLGLQLGDQLLVSHVGLIQLGNVFLHPGILSSIWCCNLMDWMIVWLGWCESRIV